jgi:predicted metal-dependent hydrolase
MQTEYDTMLYGLYVPNALIKDFLKTYYTDLTEDEQVVFNEATKYLKIKVDNSQIKFSGNVNIIVINNNLAKFDSYNPEHILLHELSHFIFNYVKDYRVLVSEAFNSLERKTAKKIVKEYMFKKGNSTIEHIADEWAAQLVSVYNNKKTKNKNIVALKKYFKDILKIDENNIYQHQP